MSNWFCYRWLPRTIFANLSYAFHVFKRGFKNIVKWFPVIFFDDWIDWSYLTRIMEFKLRDMSVNFKNRGCHVNSDRDAKNALICAILLRRITEDDYLGMGSATRNPDDILNDDVEYLFKVMNKHLLRWWD